MPYLSRVQYPAIICALTACLGARAVEHRPEPKTLMSELAKLVVREDFTQAPARPWQVKEPLWETLEGAIKATHRTPFREHHGPLLVRPVSLKNVIVEVSFKLEGKARLTVHLNKESGHLCRAHVRSDAFYVIRRDSGGDKGTRLDSRETPIAAGHWHTLILEVCGREMLASLDGKEVIFGARDDLDQPKTSLILEAEAGSVWFKNLRVWEAAPNRNWEGTRAALLRERQARRHAGD